MDQQVFCFQWGLVIISQVAVSLVLGGKLKSSIHLPRVQTVSHFENVVFLLLEEKSFRGEKTNYFKDVAKFLF